MEDIRYDSLLEAYENQEPVGALVKEKLSKGFRVGLFGMECFMPGSETYDKDSVEEGDTVEVRVIKLNPAYNNVVVSNRLVEEERVLKRRMDLIRAIQVGSIVEGRVKTFKDYGFFVSVGGLVDGLVYKDEVAWGHYDNIHDIVNEGDTVKVKVLSAKEDNKKFILALSLKQASTDPWILAGEYYGKEVECEVVDVNKKNAYVTFGDYDGVIEKTEIVWGPMVDVREHLKVGQKVMAKVIGFRQGKRQLVLSIKELTPDPWKVYVDDSVAGNVYDGKVVELLKLGLRVEIFPGVRGIVRQETLPEETVKDGLSSHFEVGQDVRVKVVSIDTQRYHVGFVLSGDETPEDNDYGIEHVSPEQREMADFLNLFSVGGEDGFKYLTHDIKAENIDLIDYVEGCKSRLLDWKESHFVQDDLFELVRCFIFGKHWRGYDGKKHYTFCSSDEWVETYDDTKEHPMNSPRMSDDVDVFRNTIRWRSGELEKYLQGLKDRFRDLDIHVSRNLRGADFYIDTRAMRLAVEEILSSMDEFAAEHPQVTVSFSEDEIGDGYLRASITIEQHGSFPSHSFMRDSSKLSDGGGTMSNIRNALDGHASWAVESRWLEDNEPRRWDILGDLSHRAATPEVDGFRHVIEVIHKA